MSKKVKACTGCDKGLEHVARLVLKDVKLDEIGLCDSCRALLIIALLEVFK